MAEHLNIPEFETEAEEAAWWDQNEDLLFRRFEQAAEDGSLGHGTLAKRGLTKRHSMELGRRMARYEKNPSEVIPWEQIKAELFKQ